MEFIDHLKEWYLRCVNVRTAMKALNPEETIPWRQPLDKLNPKDMEKTLIYWMTHAKVYKP